MKLTVCSAWAEVAHGLKFIDGVGELTEEASGALGRRWAMVELAHTKDWVWHCEALRAMELDGEGYRSGDVSVRAKKVVGDSAVLRLGEGPLLTSHW